MVLNIPFWVKHFFQKILANKKTKCLPSIQLGHRPALQHWWVFTGVDCVKIKVMSPSLKMNRLPSLKLTVRP